MKKNYHDIIFILCDTLSANRMSLYGYKNNHTTPKLEELFIKEKFCLFRNAFSSSPWTIPSHASMFTGLYPTQHGTTGEEVDLCILRKDLVSLPFILSAMSYQTLAVSSNPLLNQDTGFDSGFKYFLNLPKKYSLDKDPLNLHDWVSKKKILKELKSDLKNPAFNKRRELIFDSLFALFNFKSSVLDYSYPYTKKTLDIGARIFKNVSDHLFLFLNLMENHDKYVPPKDYRNVFGKYDDDTLHKQKWWKQFYNGEMKDEDIEIIRIMYDEEVLTIDNMVYEFIENLKSINKRRFDNSIIIITSDHGEALGEQNHWGHNFSVYPATTRIPLLIKFPNGYLDKTEEDDLVMIQDIYASLLELLDSQFPCPSGSISFISNKREYAFIQNYWSKWNDDQDNIEKDNFMAFVKPLNKGEFIYLVEHELDKKLMFHKTRDFFELSKMEDRSQTDEIMRNYLEIKKEIGVKDGTVTSGF